MASEQDPEMAAIVAIAEALEPLDLNARERALDWASARFLTTVKNLIRAEQMEAVQAQCEAVESHARRLGVKPQQVYHAFAAMRERDGLAPTDIREKIEAVETELSAQAEERAS